MRTTIDMPDKLMSRVKQVIAKRNITFRTLVIDDARIVACCISCGVSKLWSVDRDFSRFSKFKTEL